MTTEADVAKTVRAECRARGRATRLAAAAFAVVALICSMAPASAQEASGRTRPGTVTAELPSEAAEVEKLFAEWDRFAKRTDEALKAGRASTPALEVSREVLAGQRRAARALSEQTQSQLAPLVAELAALGPEPEQGLAEGESVAATRSLLGERIDELNDQVKKADFAATRADSLVDRIDELIRSRFVGELLTRGPTPLSPASWEAAWNELFGLYRGVGLEITESLANSIENRARAEKAPLLGGGIILGAVLLIWARNAVARALRRRIGAGDDRGRILVMATLIAVARLAAPVGAVVLIITVASESQLLGIRGAQLLHQAGIGLVHLIVARALATIYYAPGEPEIRLSGASDAEARRAVELATTLGAVLLLHAFLVRGGEAAGMSSSALSVLNAAVIILGAGALWALAAIVRMRGPDGTAPSDDSEDDGGRSDGKEEVGAFVRRISNGMSLAMRASALLSAALALAGYYAASQQALYPVMFSLGVIGAGVVLIALSREGVEAWVEDHAGVQALRLLPMLLGTVVLFVSLPILALIWGARVADLREAWMVFIDGVSVGDVRISPMAFISAAIVFAIGYSATRMIQGFLETSVLPNTKLDAGSRTAIASGVGYVGYPVAGLAAISTAGLDLSNVAIVAGALSVGIGFGLQTVVNNFVSGLILLIERPIKVGDWIQVGGEHGTVRRISVRATEIETFDRASLIVPNSALIADTVTNYTLGNLLGRLKVQVGVSYDSDVRTVRRILDEIARAQPMVLRYPPPTVLFMGFGDSSLDFELRVILRDVNTILTTRSDINFEIERRFREEGIEIPFPQRVIHQAAPEAPGGADQRPRGSAANKTPGGVRDGADRPDPADMGGGDGDGDR